MAEPKNLINYLRMRQFTLNESQDQMQIDQLTSKKALQSTNKLPKNYNKPKSKYKKQLFANAVSIYVIIFYFISTDCNSNIKTFFFK